MLPLRATTIFSSWCDHVALSYDIALRPPAYASSELSDTGTDVRQLVKCAPAAQGSGGFLGAPHTLFTRHPFEEGDYDGSPCPHNHSNRAPVCCGTICTSCLLSTFLPCVLQHVVGTVDSEPWWHPPAGYHPTLSSRLPRCGCPRQSSVLVQWDSADS